jgi:hypothetical protein
MNATLHLTVDQQRTREIVESLRDYNEITHAVPIAGCTYDVKVEVEIQSPEHLGELTMNILDEVEGIRICTPGIHLPI